MKCIMCLDMKLVWKWRLDSSFSNDRQHWNSDKCRCECKELIDKGRCDDAFIWNLSTCESDKSCDVGEYLDYANCKCRKRLIDKLVKKYNEDIDGNEMVYNGRSYYYGKVCKFWTLHIVLLIIAFIIIIGINGACLYFLLVYSKTLF